MELREKAAQLPLLPGVYLYKDEHGEVIYVGKAKNLRARVRSYFSDDRLADAKTGTLIGSFCAKRMPVSKKPTARLPTTILTIATCCRCFRHPLKRGHSVIRNAKDLSPGQKAAIEGLLKRRVRDDEASSIRAIEGRFIGRAEA